MTKSKETRPSAVSLSAMRYAHIQLAAREQKDGRGGTTYDEPSRRERVRVRPWDKMKKRKRENEWPGS
jgi:hypothetical protein